MKNAWCVLLLFLTAFAGISRAGESTPVVVELYTSQSCGPCLPADRMINRMASDKKVIALTLPVSYWDMLGWKDTLANPDTTARQKAYASYRSSGSVCTPQIIINGDVDIVGNREHDVHHTIHRLIHHPEDDNAHVTLQSDGPHAYQIQLSEPGPAEHHHATVWLMSLQRSASVRVSKGENKGRLLNFSNVVREVVDLGIWHGHPKVLHIPDSRLHLFPDAALVVLVQENGYGPIIAADYYVPNRH